jgi:LDH2 family malate/lactate/ureidoglycolate dehydrogenase
MANTQAAKADTTQGPFYADTEAAEAFGRRLLAAHGLSEEDAATVARCLVRADLRGVDTHGLQTLPHYLERVRLGLINPRPNLKVERVTPMVGALDGQDAFGFVVATKGMAEAIDMASEFGVGVVSAHRSTHFGMAANYTLQALDAGYIGIVFTNASKAMPPWGGREGLLGTSPIAVAAPGGREMPFDLDMARGAARSADPARLCARRQGPSNHRPERRARWRHGAADRRAQRFGAGDAHGRHGRRHFRRRVRRRRAQSF